jgi:hypothetical protein
MDEKKRIIIAHVRVGDPPKGCTIAEWYAWRKREDARMEREIAEQVRAWADRHDATIH